MAVPVWLKNEVKKVGCTHNETILETLQRWLVREMQDAAKGQGGVSLPSVADGTSPSESAVRRA